MGINKVTRRCQKGNGMERVGLVNAAEPGRPMSGCGKIREGKKPR